MGWLKKITKEVEKIDGKHLGSTVERLVGLDPTYSKTDEWSFGIEHFLVEKWMTPRGQFSKERHVKYTNKITGETFEDVDADSYLELDRRIQDNIKERYGYSKIQHHVSTCAPWTSSALKWLGKAVYLLVSSDVVRAHGVALVLHWHVDLASLWANDAVLKGAALTEVNSAHNTFPERLLGFFEADAPARCTGAAIVSPDLAVLAAGVPLPQPSQIIGGGLGFRHSAAAEFSGHSKAGSPVVVVSKSGRVSLAVRGAVEGMWVPGDDVALLEQKLQGKLLTL